MSHRLLRGISLFAIAVALGLTGPAEARPQEQPAHPPLGLMGTMPIYWGESGGFADLLQGKGEAHWARERLERDYALQPLDVLDPAVLEGLDFLLLAQPRVLSPTENVALDDWVRAGGHLLLFADPLMTGHSVYPIGDKRRPQDVILLSPILTRWGLDLQFVEDQPAETRTVLADGAPVPVRVAGRFEVLAGENAGSRCDLSAESVLAQCRIGDGTATILADAAVLDLDAGDEGSGMALDKLLSLAFENRGK